MDKEIRLIDMLTLVALVVGPVVAVMISLWLEASRRLKEQRLSIARTLLAVRHLPASFEYNRAINLIPVEFNDDVNVMQAWRDYIAVVSDRAAKADHERRVYSRQSSLIHLIARKAGLDISEADIQTEAYVSIGFMERDSVYSNALRALPEISSTLKEAMDVNRQIVSRMPPQGTPPPTT